MKNLFLLMCRSYALFHHFLLFPFKFKLQNFFIFKFKLQTFIKILLQLCWTTKLTIQKLFLKILLFRIIRVFESQTILILVLLPSIKTLVEVGLCFVGSNGDEPVTVNYFFIWNVTIVVIYKNFWRDWIGIFRNLTNCFNLKGGLVLGGGDNSVCLSLIIFKI